MKSWMFYAHTGRLLDVIKASTLVQATALFLLEHPVYKDHLAEIYVEIE
jgi:hypothetical protein